MTTTTPIQSGHWRFALMGLAALLAACSQTPVDDTAKIAAESQPATEAVEPVEANLRPFPEDSFYDLLVAEFAIRRQHYDIALSHYLYQAEQTGDTGVIATAARLAQFINDEATALKTTALWLERDSGSAEAHFIRATALAKTGHPLEALPHMEAVIGTEQESNFAALAAAALSLPDNEQREFEQALRRLLSQHPGNPNLKTGLALTLQYRNQEQESLQLIREVLATKPNSIHALLIETRLLQQLGRNEEAIERLTYAVDQHPYHKRLRLNLAQLLSRSDLFLSKAQYTVLQAQFPDDASITLALALINREIGEYRQAKQLLKSLRDTDQRDHAFYFLGRIAEQEKQWPEAHAYFRQVGAGEQLIPAITRLAMISSEQTGLAEARTELTAARERFPDQDIALYLIESDLLFEHHHYKEGYQLLSQALNAHPDNTNLLYARSLFSERQKNVAMMERDLRLILSNEPDNASALNALGYSLANLTDRLEEARALVGKALELRPQDPAIQDSYGWIAFRQGNLQVAEDYLRRAFAGSKDHEIAAHLGEVLWLLDQRQQAISVWQEGLKDKPRSLIIEETLQRLKVNLPTAELQ